jgi:homoserine kinase
LRGVFYDPINHPYTAKNITRLPAVIHPGESAGALGGFLSGSGSAIVCLALQETRAIEAAMQSQLPESEMLVLSVDNEGYKII